MFGFVGYIVHANGCAPAHATLTLTPPPRTLTLNPAAVALRLTLPRNPSQDPLAVEGPVGVDPDRRLPAGGLGPHARGEGRGRGRVAVGIGVGVG